MQIVEESIWQILINVSKNINLKYMPKKIKN